MKNFFFLIVLVFLICWTNGQLTDQSQHSPAHYQEEFDDSIFHQRQWRPLDDPRLPQSDRDLIELFKTIKHPAELVRFSNKEEIERLTVHTPFGFNNLAVSLDTPTIGSLSCESGQKNIERTAKLRQEWAERYASETADIQFYYSISNRPVDDPEAEPQGQRISAPLTGLYTRFLFNIWIQMNGTGTMTLPKEIEFDEDFLVVGSANLNDPEPCCEGRIHCPSSDICTIIDKTNIKITLRDLRAVYQLEKYCITPQMCQAPFGTLPIDVYGEGLHPSCSDLQQEDVCGYQTTCTTTFQQTSTTSQCSNAMYCSSDSIEQIALPAFGGSATQLNLAIIDYCGEDSDPIGGFSQVLNQDCNTACCEADCSPDANQEHWHQRWYLSPDLGMFQIQALQRLEADVDVTIEVETGDAQNPTETRTVSILNLDIGKYQFDTEGTKEVRVSTLNIFTPLYNALPDFTSSMLIYWGGEPLANMRVPGIFPTIESSGFGWAFVRNGSFSWGAQPGLYGSLQSTATGADISGTQFGQPSVCNLDESTYYEDYTDMPSWDKNYLSGPAPCQMSDQMNKMKNWILDTNPLSPGETFPDSITGWHYLQPHFDFCNPNYEFDLDNLQMVYHLPRNEPPQGTNEVLTERCKAANEAAGTMDFGQEINDQIQTNSTLQLITMAVDVSADLVKYTSKSGSVYFSPQSSKCEFSNKNSTGILIFVVTNPNPQSTVEASVDIKCRDTLDLHLTNIVTWNTTGTGRITMQIPALATVASPLLYLQSSKTLPSNDKVICSIYLYQKGTTVELRDPQIINCTNSDTFKVLVGDGERVDKFRKDNDSCNVFSFTNMSCTKTIIFWVLMILLFIGIIVCGTCLFAMICHGFMSKKKTQATLQQAGIGVDSKLVQQ